MVHEVFDVYYERYDLWYAKNRVTALNELKLVSSIVRSTPRPCVEVGVGTGWFASRVGCDYGVDPSLPMLRIAQRRGVNVVGGRGEALPLRSGVFGTVLIVVTICFVDDPLSVLVESRRVLRKGGRLVSCIVPAESEWGRHYAALGREGHPFYSVARFLTMEELNDMLVKAGFQVLRARGILTYGPLDEPRPEEPRDYSGREGFVCVEAGR